MYLQITKLWCSSNLEFVIESAMLGASVNEL